MSHPVRVRGLKPAPRAPLHAASYVAPRAGAWVETLLAVYVTRGCTSHPVRVRGLKPETLDERKKTWRVAPRAGAWVETIWSYAEKKAAKSRTPCGCVG